MSRGLRYSLMISLTEMLRCKNKSCPGDRYAYLGTRCARFGFKLKCRSMVTPLHE